MRKAICFFFFLTLVFFGSLVDAFDPENLTCADTNPYPSDWIDSGDDPQPKEYLYGQDLYLNRYIFSDVQLTTSGNNCIPSGSSSSYIPLYRVSSGEYYNCLREQYIIGDGCGEGVRREITYVYCGSDVNYDSANNLSCNDPETFPSHCSNYISDGDEVGTDCGGSCGECFSHCPEGSYLYQGSEADRCVEEVLPDNYGNCPSLEYIYYPAGQTEGAFCSRVFDPELGPADFQVAPLTDPWANSWAAGGAGIATNVNVIESTVDNGDGTSTTTTTRTTTETGTNPATGQEYTKEKTETTTRIINSVDGSLISENTTVAEGSSGHAGEMSNAAMTGFVTRSVNNLGEEIDGLRGEFEVPEGTVLPSTSPGDFDGSIDSEEFGLPDYDSFFDQVKQSPVDSYLSNTSISLTQSQCSFTVNVFDKELVFSLCEWESTFAGMGVLLVSIAHVFALFIVFRGQ